MSQHCFKNINPARNLSLNVKHMQPLVTRCLLGSQGDPNPEWSGAPLLGGGSVWEGHSLVSSVDTV